MLVEGFPSQIFTWQRENKMYKHRFVSLRQKVLYTMRYLGAEAEQINLSTKRRKDEQ